ncbi:hypothetical protein ClosIBUN13A_CONTIG212g03318 [Clostridium sp. IBUN13A]|nr:hypothetical protein CBDKU1_37510 [Clostridium butyricum DKU-01]KIU04766.1 hypothetical protein SC08_Contig95orf00200 [Clostridium butyricum]KJZ88631.1 hypothetical protein ClosIBUN22A_CONTIG34g00622 [Clostridium sp. IBUN22A]KJZ88725.1 hypothetical protein ClosIBUN125C_CONTIG19g01218 [Clostridium sp. IBUN125C]KJZ92897.1 hypothetical protein ClosIBUN13A_CONTIG212g03318 [Clostridium sp. IBUN13A]
MSILRKNKGIFKEKLNIIKNIFKIVNLVYTIYCRERWNG